MPGVVTDTVYKAARSSTRAKSRHQLSTLLTDAYSRRAEIEDKIAMVCIGILVGQRKLILMDSLNATARNLETSMVSR
jgi:Mitotic checkpoint regulator, MAD2B-interacting